MLMNLNQKGAANFRETNVLFYSMVYVLQIVKESDFLIPARDLRVT